MSRGKGTPSRRMDPAPDRHAARAAPIVRCGSVRTALTRRAIRTVRDCGLLTRAGALQVDRSGHAGVLLRAARWCDALWRGQSVNGRGYGEHGNAD